MIDYQHTTTGVCPRCAGWIQARLSLDDDNHLLIHYRCPECHWESVTPANDDETDNLIEFHLGAVLEGEAQEDYDD